MHKFEAKVKVGASKSAGAQIGTWILEDQNGVTCATWGDPCALVTPQKETGVLWKDAFEASISRLDLKWEPFDLDLLTGPPKWKEVSFDAISRFACAKCLADCEAQVKKK